MSIRTIPSSGEFNVECLHCGFDTKKTPEKLNEGAELKLYFCGQCKESTLIRNDGTLATIFKVES